MNQSILKLSVVVLTSMSLFSCNKGDSGPISSEPGRKIYKGDLDKKANEIYDVKNQDFFYRCDSELRDKVLEVAAAVEDNRSNIVNLIKERQKNNPDIKTIKINGYDFLETPEVSHQDAWQVDRNSWNEIYNLFKKIKENPLDTKWIWVNSVARSLILEDDSRITNATHPGVRRADKDIILSVFAKLETCFNDPNCVKVEFDAKQIVWLKEGNYHSYILDRMSSEDSVEIKRKRIRILYWDISYGASRFGFRKNKDIQVNNGELTVPLNLSILGQESSTLIERLQKAWGIFGLKLKVVNSAQGFNLKIDSTPGERAYVDYSERVLQLFSPAKMKTVLHEFGHILGFKDTYYTSFDQSSCEYVLEYNEGDIMSANGNILQHHIDTLKTAYGL